MKVVLFSASVSTHTQNWALGLKKYGVDVCVVTFADHYSEDHAKEIETYVLPKIGSGKLSFILSVFSFNKLIKKLQPDVLHAHYASSYGFVASLSSIKPYILSVWGSDIYLFPKKRLNRLILKKALSKACYICSTSLDMKMETNKYTNKNIEVIPFGIDTKLFKPESNKKPNQKFTFGIVKSLKDVYGFPKLFEAFAMLTREYKHIRLLIVGDGNEKSNYLEIVRNLKIEKYVEFVGYVSNDKVPYYINQMDTIVMPSDSESFGVAALESQACGIPVIVNNVGGLPEVVLDGKTGMIIPNNNPETVYIAMKNMLENKEALPSMGEAAIRFVKENYEWDICLQKMIKVYHLNLDRK